MAHELEMINGKASMFYVGETPWHQLGTKLEGRPTTEEAIVAAGLNWPVEARELFTAGGLKAPARAITRTTDDKILGVVGDKWTPLQNAEAFKFFDPFIASKEAVLETAGSLRGGSRVWILALLNQAPSVVVPGDEIAKYLLLSNSHDGSLAVRVGFTPIRVVCANTEAMARDSAASKLIAIRHTAKVQDALAAVQDIMNTASRDFEATVEQYRKLARFNVTEESLKKYVNLVFQQDKLEKTIREKLSKGEANEGDVEKLTDELLMNAGSRILPRVKELFETGKGNQLPGVRGTAWAAYNAVTEYLGNERGNNAETRLDSLWFGDGAKLNRRALKVGLDLVAA